MSPLQTVFNCLSIVFLETEYAQTGTLIVSVLTIFGMFGIFRKCGLTPWHALIPCLREIRTGEASGMEKAGRIAAFATGLYILLELTKILFHPGETFENFLLVLETINGLILIIQQVRIDLGLIDVFGRKKRWILLWITYECIPAVLWGWMKRYQPLWKASELKQSAADYFSGTKAEVLDQGLTVNLEERTTTEFFKKIYLLRDIHMYIQPGHMVLLLGGSGAGKTTYLNAVNGYEKAKGGGDSQRPEHV